MECLVYDGDGQLVPPECLVGLQAWLLKSTMTIKARNLLAKAEDGEDVAHNLLCLIAARFVKGGCAMPAAIARIHSPKALKSQASVTLHSGGVDAILMPIMLWNFYVACAILLYVVKLGFCPTRNRATER